MAKHIITHYTGERPENRRDDPPDIEEDGM